MLLSRHTRRREFITLIGGAVASPLSASAQQSERVRRVGVLSNVASGHPAEGLPAVMAFQQALQQLRWSDGRNVRFDIRWGENDVERDRKYAAELVGLAPDVILGVGTQAVAALQRATSSLPIVFVAVSDPVGAGFVDTLSRPGRNTTGFMLFEYSLSAKWLELLKQIAPNITRVAVLRDAANPAGIAQFGAIRATAQPLGVDVSPINVREAGEIERGIAAVAHSTSSGLIATPSADVSVHHALIVTLAARYKVPAVYSELFMVASGGLISYGPDRIDQFRRSAGYVDRILKGENPADHVFIVGWWSHATLDHQFDNPADAVRQQHRLGGKGKAVGFRCRRLCCWGSTVTKMPLEDDRAAHMLSWSDPGRSACTPVRLPQTMFAPNLTSFGGKARPLGLPQSLAALLCSTQKTILSQTCDPLA